MSDKNDKKNPIVVLPFIGLSDEVPGIFNLAGTLLMHTLAFFNRDFMQSFHQRPEYEKKVDTITKTVWTLWKDSPERIWRLLHRWSRKNEDVKTAGNNILEHGIYHGYINPDAAFDRLWEWLLSDDWENQEAASALLTAIPSHYLFETSGRWVELSKDERWTKLGAMLIRLFIIDNKRTLQIFTSWAGKHPGAFDDVIENTLKSVPILNEQDPEYYRSLDIQLRLLMEKFDKQSSVWLAADKLCKNARKLRSKAKNWQKKTGHATQFSKSSDPSLYSKSMWRRKT